MIKASTGKSGGIRIAKQAKEITLWDIYRCVEPEEPEQIFAIHYGNDKCPVGKNINQLMLRHITPAVQAMKAEFSSVTMDDLLRELDEDIAKEDKKSSSKSSTT